MRLQIRSRLKRALSLLRPKDYGLNSGERQIAHKYNEIRADHRNRYEFARSEVSSDGGHGLDCFCGNGYGAWRMSTLPCISMTGIDASEAAIDQAKIVYERSSVEYECALFPFKLQRECYDFVVCFESIEHVREDELLLRELTNSLKNKGKLFLSVPNETVIPLQRNLGWFKFHHQHYTRSDVLRMCDSVGLRLIMEAGQDAYEVVGGVVKSCLPEAQMALELGRQDGQFSLFVLEKQ